MAELPDLGQHCSKAECNQLDFLPVMCTGCQLMYCKDHSPFASHECANVFNHVEKTSFNGPKSYGCDFQCCKNKELTPVLCTTCGKNFCLSHRHQVEHACEKYEAPQEKMMQTKEHVKQILEAKGKESNRKTGKGHKSKAMTANVALMKIKLNSLGNKGLPESERVYFKVALPKGSKQKFINLFVSSQWSIGRAVDSVAELAQCENRNNVSEAKKLRLFQSDTGEYIDNSTTVKQCIKEEVFFSGSTLILEYVDNETNSLENVHLYTR